MSDIFHKFFVFFLLFCLFVCFFFQAEDGIRDRLVTGVQTCALPILQQGNEQVAAGYVLYGSSTMLVYSSGNGVNGFTLDPSNGQFCLSHPNMKMPESGRIYSMNEGNKIGRASCRERV